MVLGYTSKPVIYGSIAAKKAGVPHKVAMITGLGYAFTAQTKKAKAIRAVMSVLYKKGSKLCRYGDIPKIPTTESSSFHRDLLNPKNAEL